MNSSSHPLPAYTVTSDDPLYRRVEQATTLKLPILHAPPRAQLYATYTPTDKDPLTHEFDSLPGEVVEAFYNAIRSGQDDLVNHFIARGFVSPDVTSCNGETPLLAAVASGSLPMVSTIVALGGTVNAFGQSHVPKSSHHLGVEYSERTPLQLAAENGNLAIVRALMEDYGADDALIAPDGALALRLAAENGHREIVEYLPVRRGGAWLRWQTAHEREMRIMRRALHRIYEVAKLFIWRLPRFFIYTIPKEVVWKRRHRIADWCKRLPRRIMEHAILLPVHVQKATEVATRFIKKIPENIRRLLEAIGRAIVAIPGVIQNIMVWVCKRLKSVGASMLNIILKLLSLLHTLAALVASFLGRVTLSDVWNGFCNLIRAMVLDLPKSLWSFVATFGKMAYKALGDLLGTFGKIVWYVGQILIDLVKYVPKKLAQAVAAVGRSFLKAGQEVRVYYNPKMVQST
ncbi:hypothetical protein S40285_06334 [Stachybotrys chlorohalonatus IBT 40285]|uniref:Uncharacterized protein n=1 Tax=Stachybotrys chlorohalonatus (strain IBT 40285) TaxID=1283841 RepID=A0A084Q9Z4_STAC4|nr:hypothetical protein S40285_06334 [Stachybotrys chlorohalonata IBT 40285]